MHHKIISIVKSNSIKNNGNCYCLNCLHLFRTKKKLIRVKNYLEKKWMDVKIIVKIFRQKYFNVSMSTISSFKNKK